YEFRRTSVSQMFNRGFRGTLSFSTQTDATTGLVTATGLQEFLAGAPTGGSQRQGNTDRNTFENSHAGYIQDSYRWKKNVTLNFGVRYDYYGLIQEKHGNFTNVDTATGLGVLVGQGRLYQPDYNNWGPRVSVAWDVTGQGKTVVRAGYGIFYDAFSQDLFMGHLPYTTSFAPGPAYAGIPGPGQIQTGNPDGTAIVAGTPVFTNYSGVSDAFGVDPHIRAPYIQNY